jgi:methionyl-tRNA formyltransferase
MKLVMFGTGDFALPTFRALIEAGHDLRALVTQPDRPQGRKQELIPSPIKLHALAGRVPVFQPEQVNAAESLVIIREYDAELFVTAAYGQILSAELLSIPKLGGINLHGSILPKYRGAAPVARAIQNGEAETGVTVIRMTPRIDAGGMIAVTRTPIDPSETAGELEVRLATLGAPTVVETIAKLQANTATILPQSREKVTRAPKLSKEDGRIDWSQPATVIHDLIRAMNPWPLAETFWHPTEIDHPPVRLIVHLSAGLASGSGPPGTVVEAAGAHLVVTAGDGVAVGLKTLQIPGKKPMPIRDFLNGNRILPGDLFGDEHPLTI